MAIPELPEAVKRRAAANGGNHWVDALPGLISELEAEWGITVGRSFDGGSEAFVGEATLADGTVAILKLLMPGDGASATNEITALQLADGQGCAQLYRSDPARGAMLLEKLGPTLGSREDLSTGQRREIMISLAERLWRPAPGSGLPTGASKGRWLADFIASSWKALGRPCSEAAVEYALGCVERRIAAHDDERSVLVHGDIHEWNALEAGAEYKLIDPDGLLAEREYDLGVILRLQTAAELQSDPRAEARAVAARTGADAAAIWEWAAVERLSTAFVCTRAGFQPLGRDCLAAAEVAAAMGG